MAAAQLSLCRKRAFAALCLGLLLGEDEERLRKRNQKVHMRQWISRREERGVFRQLIRELEVGDLVAYKEFFRMTKEQFCSLLGKFPTFGEFLVSFAAVIEVVTQWGRSVARRP